MILFHDLPLHELLQYSFGECSPQLIGKSNLQNKCICYKVMPTLEFAGGMQSPFLL